MALLLALDGDDKQYQCDVLLSVMETHGITTEHLDLITEQPDVIQEAEHADWQKQWDRLEGMRDE